MFVSSGQATCFIACVAFGGGFGILFSAFSAAKFLCGKKFVASFFLDVIYFVALAIGFVAFGSAIGLPSVRLYMIIGVFFGLFLYLKSFHIILAKLGERLYNKINIYLSGLRKRINDGKEVQKLNRRRHGRGDIASRDIAVDNAVSNNQHKRGKAKPRRTRRANSDI